MNKTDKLYIALLVTLLVSGWFIRGYTGGIVSGFGLAMLFAFLFGKRLAKKTITRIDKQVKDILTNK